MVSVTMVPVREHYVGTVIFLLTPLDLSTSMVYEWLLVVYANVP